MFQHILLATDGSDASRRAVRMAVGLAREHGARLTAVYVVDPYPYLGLGEANPMGFEAYMAAALDHAAAAHEEVLAACGGERQVELHWRRVEDAAAVKGIVDTAATVGADLVVVGSHGRSGLQRLMLGSVAGHVVAQAAVPVLVAR
ncbi:MAG TPA: universal stress protein [Ramlibacter sp.]|jgi:nucleotide-binding universal stress UspA family protein|uniref:universal stress protein n=1 Tax=Ramlibacter sp. TaxID=1917967 RepID=UPI002D4BC74D|nr:universal stress protein [Ramlibacter sp.]HZY17891.1 universal stress protein [Ramlibacter sp.]